MRENEEECYILVYRLKKTTKYNELSKDSYRISSFDKFFIYSNFIILH